MWEKFKEWLDTTDSCWFFIGFFLCNFLDQLTKGNNMSATLALAIVLGNVWLLQQK